MKRYVFSLDRNLVDDFFSPVRDKKRLIEILMKSIKLMLVGDYVSEERKIGEMVLIVSKISRLFFFCDGKYVSIGFPFFVDDSGDGITFYSDYVDNIDNRVTSYVLGILSDLNNFEGESILDLAGPVDDISGNEHGFWPFLINLLMYEDGYIRYDYDAEHENGDMHPINHYDVFYSSFSTCKIGLRESLLRERMMDLFDAGTPCHFIELQRHG